MLLGQGEEPVQFFGVSETVDCGWTDDDLDFTVQVQELPRGTWVIDRQANEQYVVTEPGQKRIITSNDADWQLPFQKVTQDSAPQLVLGFKSSALVPVQGKNNTAIESSPDQQTKNPLPRFPRHATG